MIETKEALLLAGATLEHGRYYVGATTLAHGSDEGDFELTPEGEEFLAKQTPAEPEVPAEDVEPKRRGRPPKTEE